MVTRYTLHATVTTINYALLQETNPNLNPNKLLKLKALYMNFIWKNEWIIKMLFPLECKYIVY